MLISKKDRKEVYKYLFQGAPSPPLLRPLQSGRTLPHAFLLQLRAVIGALLFQRGAASVARTWWQVYAVFA